MMTNYPNVRAAFINAIAEEGTKEEAVQYLQKQWNECVALREAIQAIRDELDHLDDIVSAESEPVTVIKQGWRIRYIFKENGYTTLVHADTVDQAINIIRSRLQPVVIEYVELVR